MRVLMLGSNVASQMAITVRALRAIGVDAEGLTHSSNPIHTHDGIRNVGDVHGMSRRERLRHGYLRTSWGWSVASAIARADVVHWNFCEPVLRVPGLSDAADVHLARLLRRPAAVEFWGSDVRILKVAEEENPYYARREAYEYEHLGTQEGSYARQAVFANNGVRTCFAPPWFDRYIAPGYFKNVHYTLARLFPDEFAVRLPDVDRRRPVIMHAPSARNAKGTSFVLAAVEALKARFDFEFVVFHKMPRAQVLEAVRECDIFLDQFLIGEYGMAALEAMAFGKPTVCYLHPRAIALSPGRIPIVQATPDDLTEVVAGLLADPERRRAIGAESRAYIEAHHDAIKHARWLTGIYEAMLREAR